MQLKTKVIPVVLLAGSVLFVGCSSSDDDATTSSSTTATGSDSESTSTTENTTATGTKVNANDASVSELTDAFEAAGVPNASKWAREVEEYRPYSDDDWASLRSELAKYNIDEDTFQKIVGTLEL